MGSHWNKITRYSTRHLTTRVLTWIQIRTSYSGTSVHHHSVSHGLSLTTDLPPTQLETSKYSHIPIETRRKRQWMNTCWWNPKLHTLLITTHTNYSYCIWNWLTIRLLPFWSIDQNPYLHPRISAIAPWTQRLNSLELNICKPGKISSHNKSFDQRPPSVDSLILT